MFSDESRNVSATLTHFKLGTPAGDWARECANEALKKMPINYGTWAAFKKTFAARFIPAELALEASTIMHSLCQGNHPFNEWYQEWSTHASRARVDESTCMYAFHVNLNQGLHTKLLGLLPQPATLTELVEKAREFDHVYHLYNTPAFHAQGQCPARARSTTTGEESPLQINLYQGEWDECPTNPWGPLLKQERERRFKEKLCLYCGKPNHMARECRLRKNTIGKNQNNQSSANRQGTPGTRVRSSATIEETPEEPSKAPVSVAQVITWRNDLTDVIE
jgi:Retrotransposon gag protein/Zinc knuckle